MTGGEDSVFRLEIDCDTKAFTTDSRQEVARILLDAASKVICYADKHGDNQLLDFNGEPVGEFKFLQGSRADWSTVV